MNGVLNIFQSIGMRINYLHNRYRDKKENYVDLEFYPMDDLIIINSDESFIYAENKSDQQFKIGLSNKLIQQIINFMHEHRLNTIKGQIIRKVPVNRRNIILNSEWELKKRK